MAKTEVSEQTILGLTNASAELILLALREAEHYHSLGNAQGEDVEIEKAVAYAEQAAHFANLLK